MISVPDLARQLGILALVITGLILWRRRVTALRLLATLMLVAYLSVVAAVVLGPLPIDARLIGDMRTQDLAHNSFVPFATIRDLVVAHPLAVVLRQLGGNLLLLAPLGFVLPALFPRFTRWRSTIGAILAVSLSIEMAQLLMSAILGFSYKVFDVDDLLLNMIGGVLGWVTFRVFARILGHAAFDGVRGLRKADTR